MYLTNLNKDSGFRQSFETSLLNSNSLRIAAGYFGLSELNRYSEKIRLIAKNGGLVRLVHGMGGVEGLREKLYVELMKLHNDLKAISNANGVSLHKSPYHGKMYLFDNGVTPEVFIGSSNFSNAGFGSNLEFNLVLRGKDKFADAIEYFNLLLENSIEIDRYQLPDKARKYTTQKIIEINEAIFDRPEDFSIEINITEGSNLNLFLSKGRLNRKTSFYRPRPFYEVELTILSDDLAGVRPYLPDQLEPAEFEAITDLGSSFLVKFKRKTSSSRDMRSLKTSGIDFMSSPRKELGIYIKGKLLDAGLLNFGEPVTEDILQEYGMNRLRIWIRPNNQLYIKF